MADRTVSLLDKALQLEAMQFTCRSDSEIYTLEGMIKNFAEGVVECLARLQRSNSESFRA